MKQPGGPERSGTCSRGLITSPTWQDKSEVPLSFVILVVFQWCSHGLTDIPGKRQEEEAWCRAVGLFSNSSLNQRASAASDVTLWYKDQPIISSSKRQTTACLGLPLNLRLLRDGKTLSMNQQIPRSRLRLIICPGWCGRGWSLKTTQSWVPTEFQPWNGVQNLRSMHCFSPYL